MSGDVQPYFKAVANTSTMRNLFKVEEKEEDMIAYSERPIPSHMVPISYIMKKGSMSHASQLKACRPHPKLDLICS